MFFQEKEWVYIPFLPYDPLRFEPHWSNGIIISIINGRACMLSHTSCVWFFVTLWTVAYRNPLSMGFSRQEYWSGLPCPSPGDCPDPRIKPASLMSSALAGRFFITSTTSEAHLPVSCVSAQSCLTLWDPLDCRPLGSSVLGILQARILEWVAISSSRESSQPRDQTHISCIGRWILYHWTTLEAMEQKKRNEIMSVIGITPWWP